MILDLVQETQAKSLTYSIKNDTALVSKDVYQFIKEKLNHVTNVRVCIHSSSVDLTQFMIMGITKKENIKFHKNINKDKIYHLIEGQMTIELEDTKISLQSGELFKLSKNTFARMYSLSELCIYHEIIAGPFKSENTIWKSNE